MKVKFLQPISSTAGSFAPGQVDNLEDTLAQSWISSGICESAEPVKAPQTPAQIKADKAAADKALAEKTAAEKKAATTQPAPAAEDLN